MTVIAPHGPWVSPVVPIVVQQRYVASAPFSAGGHRPVVLRAPRGAAVAAPCTGIVSFRGRVAGGPPSLTVQCGRLLATLSRIQATVSRGSLVGAGDIVGAVAGTSGVGLSAHSALGAYRDPLPLLGAKRRRSRPPMLAKLRDPSRRRERPGRAPVAARAHLPASAYVARAGSSAAAGASPRPGRRERAGPAAASASSPPRVDLPVGLAGAAAVSLFAALSGWALLRGRPPRRHLPRLLHLARARR